MKYGKLIAILLTAVCLIGVLPLIVCAKSNLVFVPPKLAITFNTRYSNSSGGYVPNNDYLTITLPVPYDTSDGMVVEFTNQLGVYTSQYFLSEQFTTISEAPINTGDINGFVLYYNQIPDDAYFVVLNVSMVSFVEHTGFIINYDPVQEVYGDYSLAVRGHYEVIETPDSTEPDLSGVASNTLTLWKRIINEIIPLAKPFYDKLSNPIALLFGVPACIALVSLIFTELFRWKGGR